jgi:hypothetical protein
MVYVDTVNILGEDMNAIKKTMNLRKRLVGDCSKSKDRQN